MVLEVAVKVLILAGGLGTRLRSLVTDRPKPMALIKGKPFLEYKIEQLRAMGFGEFVLCVGYLSHQIQDYFGDGHCWGATISYVMETELLDTAGAIKNAQHLIEETFLVMNGDSYQELDFNAMVEYHRRQRMTDPRTIGTVVTLAVDDAAVYGTLELGARDRILGFREKFSQGPGWINGGSYVLEPNIFEFISRGRAVSIEKETFPSVLERDWHLYSYSAKGFFVDIGTPEGYQRFHRYVEEKGT